jgi:tetratricopeptide (TPR) repeat protein
VEEKMKNRWFSIVAIFVFTAFASVLWISGTASAQTATATATLVATGTATTAAPSATGEAPVTCADADALKVSNPGLAVQEYKAILVAQPKARCALAGLQTIAATEGKGNICAVADGYRQNNRLDDAGQAYKAILAVQPGTVCAVEGLQGVAQAKCTLAQANWRMFFDSDVARSIYENIQKDYPTLPCAVDGLTWLPYFQSLFVAGIVLIVIMLLAISKKLNWLFKLHLDIQDFEFGTVLSKDDLGAAINKSLIAEMERFLEFWGTNTKMGRLGLSDGPYKGIDLPDVPSAPPEAQALLKFVAQLIPKNTITVKGTLEYSKEKGAGLSVKIIGPGGRILDCQTIWRKEIDPGYIPPTNAAQPAIDEYFQLAEAAASVVVWGIQEYQYGEKSDTSRRLLRGTFGTNNRESYIFTRMAACYEDMEQQEERLLRMALDKDPDNRTALLYLGLNLSSRKYMENKKTWPEFKKKAINFLKKAIDLSEPGSPDLDPDIPFDPIYISAHYALGALEIEEFCRKDPDPKEYPSENSNDFNVLVEAKGYLYNALAAAEADIDESLKAIVVEDDVAKMIEIPYQDLRRWLKDTPMMDDDWFDHRANTFHLDGRIFYNLACHYSTFAMLGKLDKSASDEALNKALSCIRDALARSPHYANDIKEDPTLRKLRAEKGEEIDELIKQLKATTNLVD